MLFRSPALRRAIADVVGLELLAPEDLLPAAGIFAAGAALGGQT